MKDRVLQAYQIAKDRYAELDVDTDVALRALTAIPISMHCWQGDDVRGFENPDGPLTGGIQTSVGSTGKKKKP